MLIDRSSVAVAKVCLDCKSRNLAGREEVRMEFVRAQPISVYKLTFRVLCHPPSQVSSLANIDRRSCSIRIPPYHQVDRRIGRETRKKRIDSSDPRLPRIAFPPIELLRRRRRRRLHQKSQNSSAHSKLRGWNHPHINRIPEQIGNRLVAYFVKLTQYMVPLAPMAGASLSTPPRRSRVKHPVFAVDTLTRKR